MKPDKKSSGQWRKSAGLSKTKRTGVVNNDNRIDWGDAFSLFPGDITHVCQYTLDGFPASHVIDLPRSPLQPVESIRYVDTAGITQTLAPEDYMTDASLGGIGRVALACNCFWLIARDSSDSVAIQFTAGYGNTAEDVPQAISQGILIEVSNLYENREDIVIGLNISTLSLSERLLWPHRALAAD